MAKCIALFSGGLDSHLAVKLMLEQGIQVEAFTAVSMFNQRSHGRESPCVAAAARFGVPIHLVNVDREMLDMVRNPKHGLGRNMNPCIDCHIFLIREALKRMKETGADFVVSGEVLGQRPMSQLKWTLTFIEKESGANGYLLRPLSAKLLPPTVPELNGLVDREKLFAIKGRGRKEQLLLAAKLGVKGYSAPAGGCLLTEPNYAFRIREMMKFGEPNVEDVKLLQVGRHFRLDPKTKLVIGRDESENKILESLALPADVLIEATEETGPVSLLRGDLSKKNIDTAAGLTIFYGKARTKPSARMTLRGKESREITARPADESSARSMLITND